MSRIHSIVSPIRLFDKRLLILLAIVFLSLGLMSLMAPPQTAHAQPDLELSEVPDAGTWVTNGEVATMATHGGVTYIGGGFSRVGPNTGSGVIFNASNDTPLSPYLRINGEVNASASDGSGGCYIGGNFNGVGGMERNWLAHILPDGSLDPGWNPELDGPVMNIAVGGGKVYIGGSFYNVGGQPRNWLAALDAATGAVTAWNPNPNSNASDLVFNGDTVYASGQFSIIGGESRNYLAALDATTGAATAWNPNPNSTVMTLSAGGGKVFAGGYFNSIGGVDRNNLAALDAEGKPTSWDPGANSYVETLEVADGLVYAGGYVNSIGGQSRSFLAALDAATGAVTTWNPGADDGVISLSVADGMVYASGYFHNIGGKSRNYLAALDASGKATSWNPNPNDYVYDLDASNGMVYVGGEFSGIGGQTRNHLAALDATTGAATAWDPGADDAVACIIVNDGQVFAGGFFSQIGGQKRYNIAALDAATGLATGWNPGADSVVNALALRGDTVYAGGHFSFIGNNQRWTLAAVDAAGNSTDWDPNGNQEYLRFTAAGEGDGPRPSLQAGEAPAEDKQAFRDLMVGGASLTTVTVADLKYIGLISDLVFAGNTLYVSGWFANIGPYSQGGIAAFTGTTDTWYMAEGSTDGEMETWILVENPNNTLVTVDLTFDTEEGQVVPPELQGVPLPGHSRISFNAGTFLTSYNVSTIVTSHGGEVTCERALYGNGRAWASSSLGTRATGTAWYLAEGSTAGGMETWVLVQNPNDSAVSVDVSFLTGSGEYQPSELQNYTLAAHRRISIYAGTYVTDFNVSTKVVADGGGVVCERSTYGPDVVEEGAGTWATSSMGAKGPSQTWYLAEGATDEGRETWVLVENPYDLPVDVNVIFTSSQGEVQGPNETIPGKTRRTYRANDYVTAGDVSTTITSSGGGVICERAFYGNVRTWATTSPGSAATAMHWDMPEGSTDGGMETWVLVYNPGDDTAFVSLSLLTSEGLIEPPELQNLDLAGHGRLTVCVNNFVTTFHVSTHVDATSGVVCERSIYWPAGAGAAQSWATCSQGAY